MIKRLSAAAVALCCTVVLGCTTAPTAQVRSTHDDEEAIRKIIVEMTDGFNAHDARASTRMYLPDADLITVRGERYHGTAEFEGGLSSIFATRAREATQRTLNVSVRFIRPDVALAHVTNELSGLIGPDGQRPPPHQELSLRVFVKEGTSWRVAAFHNILVQPFGTPSPQR